MLDCDELVMKALPTCTSLTCPRAGASRKSRPSSHITISCPARSFGTTLAIAVVLVSLGEFISDTIFLQVCIDF